MNQCVLRQSIGHDPVRIEVKEGLYFKDRFMEYFHPLTVDEIGLCPHCGAVRGRPARDLTTVRADTVSQRG
ncbi:hypothetical protein [Tahibacter caeni]|uniref:hypothetical protein n=1 Tax=Tahibacter caeni TaxID=1453545 RepID=UPI0021496DB3|nr:hypothetical protein [Tahibacter caeni]